MVQTVLLLDGERVFVSDHLQNRGRNKKQNFITFKKGAVDTQNGTQGLIERSWSGWHKVISAAETIILPSLIGIISSTVLVGNILIVFIIIRTQKKTIPNIYFCNLAIADLVHIIGMPFLIHRWVCGGEWVFGSRLCTITKSPDTDDQFTCSAIMTAMSLDRYPVSYFHSIPRDNNTSLCLCKAVLLVDISGPKNMHAQNLAGQRAASAKHTLSNTNSFFDRSNWYTLYLTITFFFPLPLIFICYILVLYYTRKMYQQNKKAGSYTTSIPRQRVMKLTKMLLALISVFVVSTTPFHVIQLMDLQVSQPTLTFYMSYYISVCLSYASSSINPFLYILLSGNFQKHLQRCTNMKFRMAEGMSTSLKTPSSQVFKRRFFSQEKMPCLYVDFICCNR
ncbi:LOW QUALITY PROTEIN: melanin-concentrating hormone receptor 2 [Corapipo altera]|uniref:LOW QUALITY PROTEIN: melanin-concentrating hormone receptor 2 n=1 Tax=Corapipo altera TaxID=415028 RepID=UPI000FD635E5|nr:LOW QUALITY PROTEIN: melanin-concentrating hormone receptor 2 [Corapipo altera]